MIISKGFCDQNENLINVYLFVCILQAYAVCPWCQISKQYSDMNAEYQPAMTSSDWKD